MEIYQTSMLRHDNILGFMAADNKVSHALSSSIVSWVREMEIYQTSMLRHDNILGFIAADNKVSHALSSSIVSWVREMEIYQTSMLRHDNILGFIAADNEVSHDSSKDKYPESVSKAYIHLSNKHLFKTVRIHRIGIDLSPKSGIRIVLYRKF